MKKLLSLALALMMMCTFCACGSSSEGRSSSGAESDVSLESRARQEVENDVRVSMRLGFEDAVPYQVEVARLTSVGGYEWETSGSASFKDEYGDVYGGTFEGTVTYSTSSDSFSCDIDLENSFKKLKGALS